jgi:hypothetical protein
MSLHTLYKHSKGFTDDSKGRNARKEK